MADFTLRPATENDAEKLISIWHDSFGDSEEFVREILFGCGLISTAVCAEAEDEVRSAMFAFDGLCVNGIKASYIYALCTEAAYRSRGLGRAVTAFAAESARARGAELVFLRPASVELENWYADVLGALPFGRSAAEKLRPNSPAPLRAVEISAEEYLRRRSAQPWQISETLIRAQQSVHRHYGGAFLSCGENLVCAEISADGLFIREVIGPDSDTAISAAAAYFGVEEAKILRRSESGLPLMCLSAHCALKFAGIPPLPFTID